MRHCNLKPHDRNNIFLHFDLVAIGLWESDTTKPQIDPTASQLKLPTMNPPFRQCVSEGRVPADVNDLARRMDEVSMVDATTDGELTPYAPKKDSIIFEKQPHFAAKAHQQWRCEDDVYRQAAVDADETLEKYLRMAEESDDPDDWLTGVEQYLSALGILGTKPMVILDACLDDLTQTVYLHFKNRVVYSRLPLLAVAGELRTKHNVDVKWIALFQIGQWLINDAALHHRVDTTYSGPSRTSQELVARIHVHQVKSTAWDAFCWRYESPQNMQQVIAEWEAYEARFGRNTWPGDGKLEELFQPFIEVGEMQGFAHARAFYRDFFVPQDDLNNLMGGMKLDSGS